MAIFEPVALALINNWLARPQKPAGFRMAGLWLLAMSCLLTCAGVIYLLIALNTWLTAMYGPVAAALATALGAFVLAGLAAAGFKRAERPEPHAPANDDSLMETAAAIYAALEQATEGLEEPIASNPRTSVALASLAGYMAAHKLH